jgi:hypothetical protein
MPDYAGSPWSEPPSVSASIPAARETARGCAEGRSGSLRLSPVGDAHKQLSEFGASAERSTTRLMAGGRSGDALRGASTATGAPFACGTNSVERSQTRRSNGGEGAFSALRPQIIGVSIAT